MADYAESIVFRAVLRDARTNAPLEGVWVYEAADVWLLGSTDAPAFALGHTDSRGKVEGRATTIWDRRRGPSAKFPGVAILFTKPGYVSREVRLGGPAFPEEPVELGEIALEKRAQDRE